MKWLGYLGDGVYVHYDEQRESIVLSTQDGRGMDYAANVIYLEEGTMSALLRWYHKALTEASDERASAGSVDVQQATPQATEGDVQPKC